MTAMLRKVITNGTGRGAYINKPMAGKTGTTNENKDAWFIGYTPDIVTGVFIGNDDNHSIGLTGGSAPARIWKDMMIVATAQYGSSEFDYDKVEFISYDESKNEEEVSDSMENASTSNEDNSDKKSKEDKSKENKKDKDDFKSIPTQLNIPLREKLLRKKEQRQLFLGTMAVEAVLNVLLKYFFSRERPGFPHLVEVSGYSFPSGHMMAVTTFSFLILYFIWHSKMSKVKKGIFSIPFILYVVLIGLSRIYLGVHFASDVLGAFCLAVGLVSFFIFLSRSLK